MPNRHWLLRVIPQSPPGRLLAGMALFVVLYPLFRLGVSGDPEDRTPALFFSLVIAYILPVFSYITDKAQEALRELRPLLDLDNDAFELTYSRLEGAPLWVVAMQLAGGATLGVIHWSSLKGSVLVAIADLTTSLNELTSGTGTVMTWAIMTSVVSMLVQQAVVFARLGATSVRATPFSVRSLEPFARVSISASLSTIGALALFPLLGFEGGVELMEILPGAMALVAPLVAMFLLPVWPLHRRLAAMKHQNLIDIDQLINQHLDERGFIDSNMDRPEQLDLLLTYRRQLEESATWPFDVVNITRLALYMVIPPLTWVAAALIENVVDSLL